MKKLERIYVAIHESDERGVEYEETKIFWVKESSEAEVVEQARELVRTNAEKRLKESLYFSQEPPADEGDRSAKDFLP